MLFTDRGTCLAICAALDSAFTLVQQEVPDRSLARIVLASVWLVVMPMLGRGETIFTEIGCASCHVPQLMTGPNANVLFDRKPVALFSDLLFPKTR